MYIYMHKYMSVFMHILRSHIRCTCMHAYIRCTCSMDILGVHILMHILDVYIYIYTCIFMHTVDAHVCTWGYLIG